ncbi:unnamed protein product [Mesocestoides corti]|uniref:G-protein coupled receptors family 1 profile domain-containing protein n=1 Tax=Mesocestoides corti TaxID=53468 RepID=A0A0R3UF54_MESCO|nr:unnamed protein product [Mesocestoides corti]
MSGVKADRCIGTKSPVYWLIFFLISGLSLCDLWICSDVLLCTVSTLHLCAISIERCLAVSSLAYLRHRSATLVLIMVSICWILATMVSLPSRFHGRRQLEVPDVIYGGKCEINMEEGYTIYSNLLAFDLPMVFIVIMYARIYFTARKHIRKKHFTKYHVTTTLNEDTRYNSTAFTDSGYKHRRCCYCCGYVMETKFHKSGTVLRIGLTRCSEFRQSNSSQKQTTITEPPETVVAAAASAMQIAATVISTTKEPVWENDEFDVSDDEEARQVATFRPFISTISLSADNNPQTQTNYQPLTYEVIRNLKKQRLTSPCKEPMPPEVNGPIRRELSVYTNCSSLQYVDENSKQNSVSSSLYSSVMRSTDQNDKENASTTAENSLQNFVPLCDYYRQRRQREWLAHRKVFSEKASEVMKQLSVNGSETIIRCEEERCSRERLEQRRERRAVRTLAIITGCFVLCWLPFNIHALLSPFFGRIHPLGASVLLWLGYLNSLLNPIIYTIFSKEFRSAFRRIICRGPRLDCFR